eukprot:TRINITY_DN4482_c0_g2_i4.p1 TRINITY_DN4482_c0_g2~~TRINITY_DN4482_c0_g2_i4.p1  ORF type:complete len:534 (-),score=88.45 TRINITY_DN4482_c0_g2_i4:252-1853(-)
MFVFARLLFAIFLIHYFASGDASIQVHPEAGMRSTLVTISSAKLLAVGDPDTLIITFCANSIPYTRTGNHSVTIILPSIETSQPLLCWLNATNVITGQSDGVIFKYFPTPAITAVSYVPGKPNRIRVEGSNWNANEGLYMINVIDLQYSHQETLFFRIEGEVAMVDIPSYLPYVTLVYLQMHFVSQMIITSDPVNILPLPIPQSVNPQTGAGGMTIFTLSGANFKCANQLELSVNNQTQVVHADSPSRLHFTLPDGFAAGNYALALRCTTYALFNTLSNALTVRTRPVITAVYPEVLPACGGGGSSNAMLTVVLSSPVVQQDSQSLVTVCGIQQDLHAGIGGALVGRLRWDMNMPLLGNGFECVVSVADVLFGVIAFAQSVRVGASAFAVTQVIPTDVAIDAPGTAVRIMLSQSVNIVGVQVFVCDRFVNITNIGNSNSQNVNYLEFLTTEMSQVQLCDIVIRRVDCIPFMTSAAFTYSSPQEDHKLQIAVAVVFSLVFVCLCAIGVYVYFRRRNGMEICGDRVLVSSFDDGL